MVYFCSGDSVLCLYFNEINGCGIVLQRQFHTVAGFACLFCQALPKQIKHPDAYNSLGFDEHIVVGGIGVNFYGKRYVFVNVVETRAYDDVLFGISAVVIPGPDFQGRCA